ncbi:bacteriorhodopsin [Nakamurella sp. UYEF19]|uniref:bacteriorhodopsin-like n=1 Tax=Nakamurella sp. UYEF19 TaxID=1756392 RepID=UPI00339568B1
MSLEAAVHIQSLTASNFSTVYNLFSLVIASMLFTALFLFASQRRVAPRYRTAIVISAIVCGIAAYHYFRIFNNFEASYPAGATIDAAHPLSNIEFNEAYRYVDWLLTVPLLLIETVAVMSLPRTESRSLLYKLVPASALMIGLGYPGEIANSTGTRLLWGGLSTLAFLFIVFVMFTELSRSVVRQPVQVQGLIKRLRTALVALWCVYPIAFLFPVFGGSFFGGEGGFVLRQAGYSIADILAKAAFALVIFKIATIRSALEDSAFDLDHEATTAGSAKVRSAA